MKNSFILTAVILLGCKVSTPISSTESSIQSKKGLQTIENFTAGMESFSGYLPFYWDFDKDKIYLEINKLNTEILYVNSLAAGIGSNDIGLDRGQLGGTQVVRFEQHGQKILMIQPNYDYRAVSENKDETKSVQEAFASSVLWGFPIIAKGEWSLLIDISDFLLRDSHGVAQRLSRSKQGNYNVDKSRSAFYRKNILNFPKNTEFESIITFTGKPEGEWIRSVTPSAEAVSVRTHHSFIELPDSNYQPREFDPRGGFGNISYQDYATPIESPLVKRFIVRHRLEKKDQSAEISEAIEPIIYYLDRGAPEPIRSALLEGASWWNQAFEAAGFKNAFQVELLPEGAHPLDVRYNVIQWVHRSTRGWSYGSSVVDPRTGEIIKGHVSLGSLRVRQDFLIAQGLLNQYDEGIEPMKEMALARLRQLSAHEVGHTIGLTHNFASSVNNRGSVMDYPHPMINMDQNGMINLDNAYETKIGEWDKSAITFGYKQFDSNEKEELNKILENAVNDGLLFIADRDARAQNGSHPNAHLWDNGKNAADELKRMMDIRRNVLDNLSENALPTGEPYSSIEEILVPMYLFHRYQVEAASKVIGGINYTYAVKGDNQIISEMIPGSEQIKALDALINTFSAKALVLSNDLLSKIPPKAFGYNRSRESFTSKTGPTFDYYSAVETAIQMPLMFILNAQRANRLVVYNDRDPKQPGLQFVLDRLINKTWKSTGKNSNERAIERIGEWVMLEHLMMLVVNKNSQPDVKSICRLTLQNLLDYLKSKKSSTFEDNAHYQRVISTITSFMEDPEEIQFSPFVVPPDGSPIGQDDDELFFNCSMDY